MFDFCFSLHHTVFLLEQLPYGYDHPENEASHAPTQRFLSLVKMIKSQFIAFTSKNFAWKKGDLLEKTFT